MLVNVHTITHTSVYVYINASKKGYMPTPTLRISVRVRASLAMCVQPREFVKVTYHLWLLLMEALHSLPTNVLGGALAYIIVMVF